jgi:hypothetical protein
MAIWIDLGETKLSRVIQALQEVIKGNTNNVGTITLRASQTTTTVSSPIIAAGGHVVLTPRTANAAAEVGNGTLYVDPVTASGSFVIHHASNAQVDRVFTWAAHGGT